MKDAYKQGQSDAAQNKGARPENSFSSSTEKDRYFAGYKGK